MTVERQLAEIRRLAERELAGRTRRDPIPLLRDVPHALAVRLCGSGAQPPDSLRRQYDGAEASLPGLSVVVDVGRSYPFPHFGARTSSACSRAAVTAQKACAGPAAWNRATTICCAASPAAASARARLTASSPCATPSRCRAPIC